MPKGHSETVNHRTDNAMAVRTKQRKDKQDKRLLPKYYTDNWGLDNTSPIKKGMNSVSPEEWEIPTIPEAPVFLLLMTWTSYDIEKNIDWVGKTIYFEIFIIYMTLYIYSSSLIEYIKTALINKHADFI